MFLCLFGIALQYIALLTHSTLFLEFFANIQILHLPQWQTFRGSHGRDGLLAPRFGAFLIGCSFSYDGALMNAGIPLKSAEQGKNVPMYKTSLKCRSAGKLSGNMVVSMKPIPALQVSKHVSYNSNRITMVHTRIIHCLTCFPSKFLFSDRNHLQVYTRPWWASCRRVGIVDRDRRHFQSRLGRID